MRAHFEQIWNNKDASGIERFIAPAYRGFETEALISGIAGYKEHFATLTSLGGLHRIVLIVNRGRGAREIINLIYFDKEGMRYVMPKQLKSRFVEKVSYIRASTCEEVIDAEDFMPE